MLPGYNLQPLSLGFILKDIMSGTFNNAEQNGSLKILIGCVWGNFGHGEGVDFAPITFDF